MCDDLLYYKCHEINFKVNGSYIDSTDWIKKEKAAINLINKKDNKYFQCAIKFALNHEKHPEAITRIKLFIDRYNWEGIDYRSGKDDWKNLRKII